MIGQYIFLVVSGVLIENIFFTRALDAGKMMDIIKSPQNIKDFSIVFTFVTVVSSLICSIVEIFIKEIQNIVYIRPTIYLLCIAIIYIVMYHIIRLTKKQYFERLRHFIGYASINCGVFGVLFVNQRYEYSVLQSVVYGLSAGIGIYFAILVIYSAKRRLQYSDIPKSYKGLPITLIYIGLLSLGIFGLFGHQLPA